MSLCIGVMSGTSMDAVDCALVDFATEPLALIARLSTPWPATLRERLQTAASGAPVSAIEIARLDTAVGQFIASAVEALLNHCGRSAQEITAIGSHGQTIAHAPDGDEPATLQIGNGQVIAERSGIQTICDFRRRDIAAGGQGAPLAPAFHNAVLRSMDEDRVILNLGGIANITVLPASTSSPVSGFDTGPANCLMDLWARQQLGQPYDAQGEWAAGAIADAKLLAHLTADPYLALPPPKSTGTQYFSLRWINEQLAEHRELSPQQVQATLLALSVESVADAIEQHAPADSVVIACGGGTRNDALMRQLSDRLQRKILMTDEFGIDPQWVEPMAFAWLAMQTLSGRAGNLPDVTGAEGPRVLGTVHPGS